MVGLHKTKDGRMIPIVSMTTSHLINLLNMFSKPIEEAARTLHQKTSFVNKLARVKANKVTQEEIDEMCVDFLESNSSYIAELMRRALFVNDEKAKLYVHKMFSKFDESLLTDLTGHVIPQLAAPKNDPKRNLPPVPNGEDDWDYDGDDSEDYFDHGLDYYDLY